jgi:flotillin
MRRIIEACGGAQQAFQLLLLEHLDTLAQTSAQAISNIKFDKVVVWENGGNGNGTTNTSSFLQGLARTMPPILQVMKDVGGVELPEYFARLTPETTSGTPGDGSSLASAHKPGDPTAKTTNAPPKPGKPKEA